MIPINSLNQLGDIIKKTRKRSGLTLVDTAMLTGISAPVLSKMERGFKKGDVDVHTSLFKLLPEIGLIAFFAMPTGEVMQVSSRQDIASLVVNLRKQQGLLQSDLANLLGVSVPTISKIESARKDPFQRGDIRLRVLMLIINGLVITLMIETGEQ